MHRTRRVCFRGMREIACSSSRERRASSCETYKLRSAECLLAAGGVPYRYSTPTLDVDVPSLKDLHRVAIERSRIEIVSRPDLSSTIPPSARRRCAIGRRSSSNPRRQRAFHGPTATMFDAVSDRRGSSRTSLSMMGMADSCVVGRSSRCHRAGRARRVQGTRTRRCLRVELGREGLENPFSMT